MLGRSPQRYLEMAVKVLGLLEQPGPEQLPRHRGSSQSGQLPVFILLTLPADQRPPAAAVSAEGGEQNRESAGLSLAGRWRVPENQRRREGGTGCLC